MPQNGRREIPSLSPGTRATAHCGSSPSAPITTLANNQSRERDKVQGRLLPDNR